MLFRSSREGAIDLAYAHLWAKDTTIANNQNVGNVRGNIVGDYRSSVNIVSLQYSHSF